MKGLLLKDFNFIKLQKRPILIFFLISIVVITLSDDVLFAIGFLTFTSLMIAINTINYDGLDNGESFLFTLPITRKDYVLEKYLLITLVTCSVLIISTILSIVANYIRGLGTTDEVLMTSLIILLMVFISCIITPPIYLKYGGEKFMVIFVVILGIFIAILVGVSKVLDALNININLIINSFSDVRIESLIFVSIVVAILLLYVSIKTSISIMNKKEF